MIPNGRRVLLLALPVVLLVAAGTGLGVFFGLSSSSPTSRLGAGIHEGPLVLDRAQTLIGSPGAVVRGGIIVTADNVTVRDVAVNGGENGIDVDGATGVVLERVTVSGARLDGIHVRRGQVEIRDCYVHSPASPYAQGIDISFAFDLEPSLVEGCTVAGGQEGIVTHFSHVLFRNNSVTETSLRGITVTEMSRGTVEENRVEGALGIGIYCGDYSHCQVDGNVVAGTRPDPSSGDRIRGGFGVVSHFGAEVVLGENVLGGNPQEVGAFAGAQVIHAEN